MATLVLGAAGTLLGGPIGGAIGALAGRQLDAALIGSPSREGQRLTELAISSSSYGQPIARHFGAVRAPGVIFWATDLVETKETSGGGKGKPKTTSYSYSVSFAVALSSTPIESIGRIWADGDLLRGSAGDLKVAGSMRIYNGQGDQVPDPLISAAQQGEVPAMRNTAYAVFEDLDLGDFGSRIPALSFEIFERTGEAVNLSDIANLPSAAVSNLEKLVGYSDNGGAIASSLGAINQVSPLRCTLNDSGISLSRKALTHESVSTLPAPLHTNDAGYSNRANGPKVDRAPATPSDIGGLRYYDRERDYQISLQRSVGHRDQPSARILEFPATMSAGDARNLCSQLTYRERWQSERITLKLAELDLDLSAGKYVSITGTPGFWRIASWEWMDRGIELELERMAPAVSATTSTESGALVPPVDLIAQPTQLSVFELPPTDVTNANTISKFAAITGDPGWVGASLYAEIDGDLSPLELSTRDSATVGNLVSALEPSASTHLERTASMVLDLSGQASDFQTQSIEGIARGANRLYLGGEIIQFAVAEPIAEHRWKLTGLLRGRAGTEHLASLGHAAGTRAILLDTNLVQLPADNASHFAAIGLGDQEPAVAEVQNPGSSTKPLAPVHARVAQQSNGDWETCWTRRARGAWQWLDYVDAPLVEETETYVLGVGPVSQPYRIWTTTDHEILIEASEISSLETNFGPASMWVMQVGTFGQSPATYVANIQQGTQA